MTLEELAAAAETAQILAVNAWTAAAAETAQNAWILAVTAAADLARAATRAEEEWKAAYVVAQKAAVEAAAELARHNSENQE